jgi:phage shock protein A
MEKITMEVTFEFFKHICFDIWKFKNMVHSSEEYIVMDKVRRYFPDRESNGRSKDENILDTLMNIIDGIKQEEEIIYCDTNPAKDKVVEYFKNTSKHSEAIRRLTRIIEKIDNIQKKLEEDPTTLIRPEVETIRKLIKAIPDDKERKLFQDNLYDDSRLYNGYLPLTNVLMVVLFISIGKKRDKNYQDKIDSANQEIAQLKGMNKEINGKWQLLKDMKEQLSDLDQDEIVNQAQKKMDDVYAQNYQAIMDARESLNKIIEIKNKLEKSKFEYYKNIRDSIIKPKDI